MPQIQSIRRMRRNGESIAAIARKQHVSEPTVRKYLRMDDLSEKPPVRRTRGSVICLSSNKSACRHQLI